MNNRTIAKGFFLAAIISASIMVLGPFAQSFSQNNFLKGDVLLRIYLGGGSLGFAFMCANSLNRNNKILGVRWGYIYLWMAVNFLLISAFNLEQLPILHKIVTGFVAVGALPLAFAINDKKGRLKRLVAFVGLLVADGYFLYQFLTDGNIASGELAISIVAVLVAWIIINEKATK